MNNTIRPDALEELIRGRLPDYNCGLIHPNTTCSSKAWDQVFLGFRAVGKMYLLVHLIPFLLFKLKRARKRYPPTHLVPSRS